MALRIVIVTLGSQGDVQPFAALGIGLKAAGHAVKLATGKDFESFVQASGLNFVPVRGDIRAMLSTAEGQRFIRSRNPLITIHRMKQVAGQLLGTMQEDILKAVEGADAVVFSYLCGPVIDVAEKTGLPCFLGLLQPLLRTGEFPHFTMTSRDLGPALNRLTYDLFQLIMWAFFGNMANRWRRERFGLPPVRPIRRIERLGIPVLGAFSPEVIPKPADWPDNSCVTGYWFLDTGVNWQSPIELQDFLIAGQRPVCISFGSMVHNKPEQIKEIVCGSLKRARQRAILIGGWGGLGEAKENSDMIFCADSVPYDWLFPRVAAVIHHGGAGTTAAALRAGVPSVVVPFFADQPFWAHRVHMMGVSPQPIPRRSLTSARLTHAIRVAVQDEGLRQRAADIGHRIRNEDGVAAAIEAIQRHLETRSRKGGALSVTM